MQADQPRDPTTSDPIEISGYRLARCWAGGKSGKQPIDFSRGIWCYALDRGNPHRHWQHGKEMMSGGVKYSSCQFGPSCLIHDGKCKPLTMAHGNRMD